MHGKQQDNTPIPEKEIVWQSLDDVVKKEREIARDSEGQANDDLRNDKSKRIHDAL